MSKKPDENDRTFRYRVGARSPTLANEKDHAARTVAGDASHRPIDERSREENAAPARRNEFGKLIFFNVLSFVLGGVIFAALMSGLVYVYLKANDPELGYVTAVVANWRIIAVFGLPGGLYGTSLVRLGKRSGGSDSYDLWHRMVPRSRRGPWNW